MISGYLLTMMNPIVNHLTRYYEWDPDVAQSKFVLLSTILTIGSACGCLVAGHFIGWGRRRTLVAYCVFTFITTAMSLSGNEIMLFSGRFMIGIFFGVHGAVFPLYNYEMSPKKLIGSGGAIQQVAFCCGTLYPTLLAMNLKDASEEGYENWMRV